MAGILETGEFRKPHPDLELPGGNALFIGGPIDKQWKTVNLSRHEAMIPVDSDTDPFACAEYQKKRVYARYPSGLRRVFDIWTMSGAEATAGQIEEAICLGAPEVGRPLVCPAEARARHRELLYPAPVDLSNRAARKRGSVV